MKQEISKPLRMPSTGTDFRDDNSGVYQFPHPFYQRAGEPVEEFVAVSKVLELLESFGKVREVWQSKHTVELAELGALRSLDEAAYILLDLIGNKRPAAPGEMARLLYLVQQRKTYSRWDHDEKRMIEANPIDLILDREWIEGAGWRELSRVANRGSAVHAVIEEFALKGQCPVDYDDEAAVFQYTIETIQDERARRGSFYVEPEAACGYIAQALRWMDMYIEDVLMAETAVFNRTCGYAGTVDLDVKLKGLDGVWRIDAKTSSRHYDSHRIQLSAYYNAEFAAVGNGQSLVPITPPDHTANLYIGTDRAILREHWTDKKGVVQPMQRDLDFVAFFSLLTAIKPRVTKQRGADGRNHAINPVTVKACTNRPPKAAKDDEDEDG